MSTVFVIDRANALLLPIPGADEDEKREWNRRKWNYSPYARTLQREFDQCHSASALVISGQCCIDDSKLVLRTCAGTIMYWAMVTVQYSTSSRFAPLHIRLTILRRVSMTRWAVMRCDELWWGTQSWRRHWEGLSVHYSLKRSNHDQVPRVYFASSASIPHNFDISLHPFPHSRHNICRLWTPSLRIHSLSVLSRFPKMSTSWQLSVSCDWLFQVGTVYRTRFSVDSADLDNLVAVCYCIFVYRTRQRLDVLSITPLSLG